MSADKPPRYLTRDDLAELFPGLTRRHIDRNFSKWPHIEIGRRVLFSPEHVEAIAKLHERNADSGPERPAFASQVTRGGK